MARTESYTRDNSTRSGSSNRGYASMDKQQERKASAEQHSGQYAHRGARSSGSRRGNG